METTPAFLINNSLSENFVNPFKGPKSYEEQDSYAFYGRGDEISKLFQLIRLNVLTILYSQSGVGKSSLLRAGLMPTLRHSDYLPIYIRPHYGNTELNFFEFIVNQISVSIDKMTAASTHTEYGYTFSRPTEDETLFEYFNRNPFYKYVPIEGETNKAEVSSLIPVLIFDQFEEIFTIGNANQNLYSFLKDELSYLIENNIPPSVTTKLDANKDDAIASEIKLIQLTNNIKNYKVVFSLREEFLSNLESISIDIPSVFYTNSKFRLTPFTKETANEVILKISEFVFDSSIAENIIKLISEDVQNLNISRRKKNEVEPFLLSLVCFHLYPKFIDKDVATIERIQALDYEIVDEIFNNYYLDSLQGMPGVVKIFIEEELLTDKGNRTLHNNDDAEKKVGKEYIDKLVDEFRLLRKEEFLDSQHLEIIHDRITPIIIESRNLRRGEENKIELDKAKKKQEEENERNNEKKLLEIEKNRAIDYQEKLKELEAKLTKFNEQRLLEATEKAISELNEKFAIERISLRHEYENDLKLKDDELKKKESEKLKEVNREQIKNKELNDKLSLQIQKLSDDYESKLNSLQEKKAVDIENSVAEIKLRYSEERHKLSKESEFLKISFDEIKKEKDNLEKDNIYREVTYKSNLKTRLMYISLSSILAILAIITSVLFYFNLQKSNLEIKKLTPKMDSINFLNQQLSKIDRPDSVVPSLDLNQLQNSINILSDSLSLFRRYSFENKVLKDSQLANSLRYKSLLTDLTNKNSQVEILKLQLDRKNVGSPKLINEVDSLILMIDLQRGFLKDISPSTAIEQLGEDSSRVENLMYTLKRSLEDETSLKLLKSLEADQIKYLSANLDQLHTLLFQKSYLKKVLINAQENENLLQMLKKNLTKLTQKYSSFN